MSVDAKRVQAIFLAAVEAGNPAQQAAIVDRECSSDVELRRRVEALLEAHRDPASILHRPAVAAPPAACRTDHEHGRQQPAATLTETMGESVRRELDFLEPPTLPGALGRIGHYEVLEVIGRGGFGIVLRAQDETLQRVVAVKVLAPQMAATSPARKRFLREARSYAAIRHENVVQVYAVEERPLPYLVMEFIPGGTLQELLDRTGPLDVAEVLSIGRQIAEGLAAAHGTGLIHRDVKPANILIEEGPLRRVKLTDFGLARAADDASISQSGVVAGTPSYMAPEQAKGDELDHRADLFSLGSVLYVMCAGRPPFRANGAMAILKRVCEDTPRPIREIIPETPVWLCDLIARLHAKDPAERFQSAREVADLLRRYQDGIVARGNVDWATMQPPSPWRWARAAAALACVLIGIVMAALFRHPGRPDVRDGPGPETVATSPKPRSKFVAVRNGSAGRLPRPGRTSWFAQDRASRWLAVPCENTVVFFDARTLMPVKELDAGADRVYQVAFSPDGQRLATASWADDGSVVVWNLESGTEEFELTHPGHCWAIQFSPDGGRLLTLGESHVPIVWDLGRRAAIRELSAQVRPVCADVTFGTDGNQIITHVRGGDIKVWDARTWEGRILPGPEHVAEDVVNWLHLPLVASPDGKWLAAGSPSGFKVWATADWRERPTVITPATWLAFSPDGRTIYTAPHECPDDQPPTVTRWDTATGTPRGKPVALASRGLWVVYHLSVDGRTLYAMACDPAEPTIHVYDAETLVERFLPGMGSSK